MKANRPLATLLALSLCVGPLALCSCSSDASSEPKTSVVTTAAAAEEQKQIAEDFESFIATRISKDQLLANMRENESMKSYEQSGADLEGYAEKMASKYKVKIRGVDMLKDKAVAHAQLVSPDFGKTADALVAERYGAVKDEADVASMSEDELMCFYMELLTDVLADPSFPLRTDDIDAVYVKKDGSWQMDNPDTTEAKVSVLVGQDANLSN